MTNLYKIQNIIIKHKMKNIFGLLFLFSPFIGWTIPTEHLNRPSETKTFFLDDDCDACGCSANGGSMGYSSILDQNFIGIRYFHQYYKSKDGLYNDSPWIAERFNTIQLWAKIPIHKRVDLSVLVPYQFHNSAKTSGEQSISGLGDLTVLGLYNIVLVNSEHAWQHQWHLGAGVKAPTGKYNAENKGTVNPSFQVGTGAWDFSFTTEYMFSYKEMGLQTSLNYTFKSENEKHYQFGNQFSYTSTFFYPVQVKAINILPQLGIAGEVYASNKEYGELVKDTKGSIFFGKMGVEVGYDRFSFGLNGLLPISQNLTGGKVEAKYRWSLNLNYSI